MKKFLNIFIISILLYSLSGLSKTGSLCELTSNLVSEECGDCHSDTEQNEEIQDTCSANCCYYIKSTYKIPVKSKTMYFHVFIEKEGVASNYKTSIFRPPIA